MIRNKITKRLIFGIVLLLVSIFLFYILNIQSPSYSPEEKILDRFNLSRNDTQITLLTNLSALKQKYPVVYGEANEGDYEIRTTDKLIIYDYTNDKVIKVFDLSHITIG